MEKQVKGAQKDGFAETLFGRKRQVPELQHKDKMTQQAGRRIALNTPIQGSAADLMKEKSYDRHLARNKKERPAEQDDSTGP